MKNGKLFCASLLLFVHAVGLAATDASMPWIKDFDSALERAAAEEKPVFLEFSATWCGPCRQMERTTLKDPAVVATFSRWSIPMRIDIDREQDLAARFKVASIPTVMLVNSAGRVIARSTGFIAANELIEWFRTHYRESRSNLTREQWLESQASALTEEIISPDVLAQQRGLSNAVSLLSGDDADAAAVAARAIREAAAKDPQRFVPHLHSTNLMIRIAVDNALTSALPAYEFDPWADPIARSNAVEALVRRH